MQSYNPGEEREGVSSLLGRRKLMKLSLEEIIQDLRALEARIRAYERKYGVTSQDFYALYR